MPDAAVTGLALGGRACASGAAVPGLVPEAAIAAFAERHRKALRYLNRGSIVLAAVLDAVVTPRWSDPARLPPRLGLVVGSAFGNQGETTRYFRTIRALGPDQVGPMASYDVAVNAFVSFASLFFHATGPVQTLSSGAVSGLEALAGGVSMLAWDEADAVLVAGIEHECPEAYAYAGHGGPPGSGAAESAVVLLLERTGAAGAVCPPPIGTVLGVETGFAPARADAAARLAGALLARSSRGPGSLAAACSGPSWTGDAGLAGVRPDAWIASEPVGGSCQLGAAGLLGVALVLARLGRAAASTGLAVATDPAGWIGAALLAGPASTSPAEEMSSCRP